ncbi:MAG: TetR/AcrR family transcriptional regulator [Bacteroidales bacterium]|nr:TetR/AcrR family transcriptional regulator [Bacteroidales bacterium]
MLEEGYAAVSARRVAKEAGLKAPLVHYHFPTTDDLFLAVFRRAVVQELDKLEEAELSSDSLLDIWHSYQNSERTALALEFMALANHRKAIRDEIAAYTVKARQHRAKVLATLLDTDAIDPKSCSTAGLAVLMLGVARTLVLERGLGISLGHDDANQFVEWWLEKLKKD